MDSLIDEALIETNSIFTLAWTPVMVTLTIPLCVVPTCSLLLLTGRKTILKHRASFEIIGSPRYELSIVYKIISNNKYN